MKNVSVNVIVDVIVMVMVMVMVMVSVLRRHGDTARRIVAVTEDRVGIGYAGNCSRTAGGFGDAARAGGTTVDGGSVD